MTGRLLALIDNLLKFQKINIHLKDYSSKSRLCTIGVLKGSVLPPILFAIFISDMLSTTTGIKLQYADDTTLLVSAKQNSTSGEPCQYNFNALESRMHKWRIRANSSKTDLLLFHDTCPIPKLSGAQIIYTKQTKVLGIIVDDKLKFGPQLKVSKPTLSSKLDILKPFIFSSLKINTSLRILKDCLS